jgi:hypothetical protein
MASREDPVPCAEFFSLTRGVSPESRIIGSDGRGRAGILHVDWECVSQSQIIMPQELLEPSFALGWYKERDERVVVNMVDGAPIIQSVSCG